eukprot:8022108-Heterocapsa_arctica.AAC.1
MSYAKYEGRCVWCNPAELRRRCQDQRLCLLLASQLGLFFKANKDIYTAARDKIPAEWREVIVMLVAQKHGSLMEVEEFFNADLVDVLAASVEVVQPPTANDAPSAKIVGKNSETISKKKRRRDYDRDAECRGKTKQQLADERAAAEQEEAEAEDEMEAHLMICLEEGLAENAEFMRLHGQLAESDVAGMDYAEIM